jgi:hypothetical protein
MTDERARTFGGTSLGIQRPLDRCCLTVFLRSGRRLPNGSNSLNEFIDEEKVAGFVESK